MQKVKSFLSNFSKSNWKRNKALGEIFHLLIKAFFVDFDQIQIFTWIQIVTIALIQRRQYETHN